MAATLATLLGVFLLFGILWDSFEIIVLPRTVTRGLRFTRAFYRSTWAAWREIGRRITDSGARQRFLGIYGPLSLPILLSLWAIALVVGFALLQWAQQQRDYAQPPLGFGTLLYASGVTFFTLGYGDVVPHSPMARVIAVLEAGVGFGFLALVIGYLPVLYSAFSRREATISRLDARASSPPSAAELLRRFSQAHSMPMVAEFLREWEQWASELLESHLSYPVLTYYRSQHEHQSWLSALTAIMDTCTLIIVGVDDAPDWLPQLTWQAKLTFAMARHAMIDLAYIFNTAPIPPDPERLPPEARDRLRAMLAAARIPLRDGPEQDEKLAHLRGLYEPYVNSLAHFLVFSLPPWLPEKGTTDNWETSAWEESAHF